MPKIKLTTYIKSSKEVVFDLSRSVELHQISTHKTKEEVVAGKMAGLVELNETVTWRAKHLGFYQKLTSKITEFNYPEYFVDEMQQGAFESFRHEHLFIEDVNGLIKMEDIFDYTSPFGFIGKFFDFLFLKRYMERLLKERNQIIKEFAETDKWKEVLN